MEELLEALAVEDGDRSLDRDIMMEPSVVVECCKSLVIYDEETGLVRFAHETVQDFVSRNIAELPGPCMLAKSA
jgi:hypothetical protein